MWKWSVLSSIALFGAFLVIDLAFFSANVLKFSDGGWFPLAFGAGVFLLMSTWKRGRQLLQSRLETDSIPLDAFVASASLGCTTVPGSAVFMTTTLDSVPHALLHSLKHYKSLHTQVILLAAVTLEVPHVPEAQRVVVETINGQFRKVQVFFGFMDTPDLPRALEWCGEQGLQLDMMDTSFFLGRETLIPKLGSEMAFWRERLFVSMYRNATDAANYFMLPPNRVVELGSQVVL
jgi:KUP system potassium uptake protein